MALIPALITVNFTSNYAGDHRVCWRTNFSGPYDCSTIVTCLGGGNPCQAQVVIQVDNETCPEIIFDGYVQPICNDILSVEGQVPFQVTFTPNPVCDPYLIACISASILDINIINPGDSYLPLPSPPPVITFLGGGSGATATALVGVDGILTLGASAPIGTGYTPGVYLNVPFVTLTGVGTGAIASSVTIPVSGQLITSNIVIDTLNAGSGYVVGNQVKLDSAFLGGAFTLEYKALVSIINYGKIIDITLNTPGSGYFVGSATVAASPNPDAPIATVEVLLAPCPDQLLGGGCNGNPPVTLSGLEVGQSVTQCMTSDPIPEAGIDITLTNGCCYDCVQATFTLPEGQPDTVLYYTDCATKTVIVTNMTQLQIVGPVCVVNDSWWWTDSSSTMSVVTSPTCP